MNVNDPLCLLDVKIWNCLLSRLYKVMICQLMLVLLPPSGQNSHWSQVSKLFSWTRSDCFVPPVCNWGFCDRGVRFITPHIYSSVESASSKYNLFCHSVVIHAWEYTIREQIEPESPDVLDNTAKPPETQIRRGESLRELPAFSRWLSDIRCNKLMN